MASLLRVLVLLHNAACGRVWPPACLSEPWHEEDVRSPMRALHVIAALRFLANGHSLLTQFACPSLRTTSFRGHDELRRRAYIRAVGVPLHLARAVLKLTNLDGTRFERSPFEIGVNVVRAVLLIPISTWSLHRQWMTPPRRSLASSAAATEDPTAAHDEIPAARADSRLLTAALVAAARPSLLLRATSVEALGNEIAAEVAVGVGGAAKEERSSGYDAARPNNNNTTKTGDVEEPPPATGGVHKHRHPSLSTIASSGSYCSEEEEEDRGTTRSGAGSSAAGPAKKAT